MQKTYWHTKQRKKVITSGYDCVKKLPFCLESIPEALYGGVIRRSAIRASQVPGSLANQARYGTVSWQVGHLQSSFSRSHSRSDRPKKKEKKKNKKSLLIFRYQKMWHSIYIRTVSSVPLFFALLNCFKVVYGPFGQSNMQGTLCFCPDQTSPAQPGRNQMYQS